MPTPHPFVIAVRDIVHQPGTMREVIETAPFGEKVGEGLAAVLPEQPVELTLRLESVHEGILATGTAATTALATCARCLTQFDLDLDVDFLELFAYDGASDSDYLVVDETVDMLSVVRDAVVLALPFQPVDRPDCSGLDPETGERLEPGTEFVPAETIDPRWAALQGIAQELTDDESDDDAPASKKE